MYFYLINLFESLFIILNNNYGIYYGIIVSFIKDEIKFNLKSIQTTVIFKNSQDSIIELIKIFYLKFYKIQSKQYLKDYNP